MDKLRGALVICFVDNDGVLFSMKNGGAAPEDVNVVVGKLSLQMAEAKIGWFGYGVESHANVADGPTRDRWLALLALNSQPVTPCWPEWVMDFWSSVC